MPRPVFTHGAAVATDAQPSRRVLIVDDDETIAAPIAEYLKGERFDADVVATARGMRHAFETHAAHAVILDLKLPDDSGWNALGWLRARSDVPIIIVSGKGDVLDRILGLELGADDYLVKPFELRELVARLHCVLRRAERGRPHREAVLPQSVSFGGWTLDFASQQLTNDQNQRIHLTRAEYLSLSLLVRNPNRVVTRDQLMGCVGPRHWDPLDRSVDIRIGKLRRKIDRDPTLPSLIHSVRGAGYMFVPERG
jgi:DNA-binding response OmpR family regulator